MYSIDDILNGDIDETEEGNVINEDNETAHDLENDNDEDNENEEVKRDVKDDDKEVKKTRKGGKRVVLNAETLKNPRGLICMESTFSKLKFRGHGYEQEDLDTVMNSLQHWCHRLYPRFTFDDTLEQIEKLGTKKTVMLLRKKIIMNMVEEEINLKPDDDDDEPAPTQMNSSPKVDQFDLLFNEDRPPLRPREPSPEIQITEEQLEIMERNRMLAAERRRARLAQETINKENLEDVQNSEKSNDQTVVDVVETMVE